MNYNKTWSQTHEDLLENFILKSDSYKLTHWLQLPENAKKMVSYFEARGCSPKKLDGTDLYQYVVLFELQYILLRHFTGQQITKDKLEQARKFSLAHFGKDLVNVKSWEAIIDKYDGYLPIKVRAIEEGLKVPLKTAMFTVENLDDSDISFWATDLTTTWLTNYSETLFSHAWNGSTIMTNSLHALDIIKKFHNETVGNNDLVPFSLHDFGGRGGSSYETSITGDMAHLAAGFMGTDTMQGIVVANKAYGEFGPMSGEVLRIDDKFKMYGFSVFATEHSTTTINGRHGERDFIIKCLKKNMGGITSMVGDSYSIKAFCKLLSEDDEIKALIIENGGKGGKFVLRPDSGDPVEICLMLIRLLEQGFGTTINSKGYKELPKYIGLLQGDGIDLLAINNILQAFKDECFASNNIIFGSGGGLIQKFDRDTLKCAIKAIYAIFTDGSTINILKDPDTAPGKKSKTGLIMVYRNSENKIVTKDNCSIEEWNSPENMLQEVFNCGVLTKFVSLSQVRANTLK